MNTVMFSCSHCGAEEREDVGYAAITCKDCGRDAYPKLPHINTKLIRQQENGRSGHETPWRQSL